MNLDDGEAEAIALAVEKSADLILLDDYEAREPAKKFELRVTGTIGVLLVTRKEGIISTFKELLDELRNTGFWLSDGMYVKVLKEAESL